MKIIKGRILNFIDNPFKVEIDKAYKIIENGAILIDGSFIKRIDLYTNLITNYPNAQVFDYGSDIICSGFIDCHMHYPQTGIIASYGKRLIDWLNTYTFPEEVRFKQKKYAKKISSFTLNESLKNGITSLASFCTTSIESVDAIFEEAEKLNMCIIAGKTCMDRNGPKNLIDTPRKSYQETKYLINKWHCKDRLKYAITPRFAPTSSPKQLELLGELAFQYKECLIQTHLGEQIEEIEWVRKLFPYSIDYLGVYESFGLVGETSIFGHSIHLKDREFDVLKEKGSSVAHCPTSNFFIGSGLFNIQKFISRDINFGLATDTGGGTSFSMFKTMAAAYYVAQLNKIFLHPAQLFWMATVGSAKSLKLNNEIGNIQVGNFADFITINLSSTNLIKQRRGRATSVWEEIFPTIIMGDDRAISSTWVSGELIKIK